MSWHKFMAVQIRLWHGLLILVVCLGVVLGVIFGITLPSKIHETQHEMQNEMQITSEQKSELEAEITPLQNQSAALAQYLKEQLLIEQTNLIKAKSDLAEAEFELEKFIAHFEQFQELERCRYEGELSSQKERCASINGKIAVYEEILGMFYGQ